MTCSVDYLSQEDLTLIPPTHRRASGLFSFHNTFWETLPHNYYRAASGVQRRQITSHRMGGKEGGMKGWQSSWRLLPTPLPPLPAQRNYLSSLPDDTHAKQGQRTFPSLIPPEARFLFTLEGRLMLYSQKLPGGEIFTSFSLSKCLLIIRPFLQVIAVQSFFTSPALV